MLLYITKGGIKMVKFMHWEKIPEFPFFHVVEEFKVDISLDKAWDNIDEILKEHGFKMEEHFSGFIAFPFGESAEEATEGWEGGEV